MNKFSWRWISCNVVNSTKAFITPNLDYNLSPSPVYDEKPCLENREHNVM